MPNWGQALQGAIGGAGAGAGTGTPWGVAGGAALGLLGGLFGGGKREPQRVDLPYFQDQYNQYGNIAAGAQGREAAQLGPYSQFRGGQEQLAQMLMQQAQGQGPGQELVRRHAEQQADRAMRQQMAQAATSGGGALAARNAALGSALASSAVGQQRAMGGLQAQLGAIGQLGGVLQGARGQDLQYGTTNLEAQMRQRQLNDLMQQDMLRQRLMAAQAQQSGGLSYEALQAQMQQQPSQFQGYMSGLGALGQGLGMMRAGKKGGAAAPTAASTSGGSSTSGASGSGGTGAYYDPYQGNPSGSPSSSGGGPAGMPAPVPF